MKIAVSMKGNIKLGKAVINISLPPVLSCQNGIPCYKDCYALKAYRQYPNTRKAWNRNLKLYLTNADEYFTQINSRLERVGKESYRFRWHVGGDILDIRYLTGMIGIAVNNPKGQFLAYTKNYGLFADIEKSELPSNFALYASVWPNYAFPEFIRKGGHKIAWLDNDQIENRVIKEKVFLCSASCQECYHCWDNTNDNDVMFKAH